ncbi:MAG: sulfatase [Deltaproteobacteria bacterium]|nr:sulfatase [Deltaproteobacteria bacterium]
MGVGALDDGRRRHERCRFLSLAATRVAAMVATALVAVTPIACRRSAEPRATRIVLISLDTLRYDAFAGDADRATAMPLTLAWARNGAVFEHHYAASSSTHPSHATMFTGLHPWEHGVHSNGIPLGESSSTVAEVLHANGYATHAVVGSRMMIDGLGWGQGFDTFVAEFTEVVVDDAWAGSGGPIGAKFYSRADTVTRAALAAIDGDASARQFHFIHYFDPHAPYGDGDPTQAWTPPKLREVARAHADVPRALRAARDGYDDDTRYLDAQLGRVLNRLADDRDRVDTHVMLTADHGECFGEDGSFAHGQRLLPAVIHVPLVVLSPKIAAGRRSDVTGSVDVMATLLALAAVDYPAPRGRSVLVPAVPERSCSAMGMRRTFTKPAAEIRADGRAHALPDRQFYCVDQDGRLAVGNPTALESVESPARAALFKGIFTVFDVALSNSARAAADPQTVQTMRALGYVQ